MGKIKRGILGGFQGKVANVIGQGWKGIDVMRSMPISVANPRTPAQTSNRTKFGDLVEVSKALGSAYLRKTFDKQAIRKTTFNAFVSANMKGQQAYPVWTWDMFELAGEYADGAGYQLSVSKETSSNEIVVSFQSSSNPFGFVGTDKVSVGIVYNNGTDKPAAAASIEQQQWSYGSARVAVPNVSSVNDFTICLVVTKQADGKNYCFLV